MLGRRQQRRAAVTTEEPADEPSAAAAARRTVQGSVWLNGRLLGRCAEVERLASRMRMKRRKGIRAFKEVREARA